MCELVYSKHKRYKPTYYNYFRWQLRCEQKNIVPRDFQFFPTARWQNCRIVASPTILEANLSLCIILICDVYCLIIKEQARTSIVQHVLKCNSIVCVKFVFGEPSREVHESKACLHFCVFGGIFQQFWSLSDLIFL